MAHYTISQLAVLLCVALFAHAQTDIRLPPSISGSPLGPEDELLSYFETEETMNLQCKASGVPEPKIEWYVNSGDGEGAKKVDLNKPNVEMLSDGSLEITAMTSLDEGEYHCTATNTNGKAMSISAKLVKATLGRYPPSAVQTYTADEGDPLMIPCQEVKSVPEAIYAWALAETEEDESPKGLTTSERLVISPKGYLYFANMERADERGGQLYKCNVFNPTLDITVGGSYAQIKVDPVSNVQDKPPLLQYPASNDNKPVIAVLGEQFELKCIFSGRPAPTVTWKKVGGTLPGGRYNDQLDDGTMLRIENVEWSDEADYVCTGTNSEGSKTYTITVDVQSKPTFVADPDRQLMNKNVTQGKKAEFFCEADAKTEPNPEVDFMINAVKLDDQFPGPRKRIDKISGRLGKILSIENVCKDCVGGGTDLMGIQCRIRNTHGTVFKSVYLNILLPVAITQSPEDVKLTDEVIESGEVSFECAARADDSTPVSIVWLRDDKQIYPDRDERITIDEQNTLHINIENLENNGEEYVGVYTCEASNGYSDAQVEVKLTTPDGAGVAPVASAGVFDMWWIFIIIALILLLLILLLCCCLCIQRNKGDTYPVDEKERANGNDPEKELADSGFHDYQRPEDEPVKGSRASLTSTIKLDSDDEGSLNEYGDIDTGKFNEDGSFIGQYMNDKKKKKAFDSTV